MITNTPRRQHFRRQHFIGAALLALAGWFCGLALLAVLVEPTPTVLVIGPQATIINAAVQANVALIEIHPAVSRMRSNRPGFVRALYANGAWLVLPSPEGGCLGL